MKNIDKRQYESPKAEVIIVKIEGVICDSGNNGPNNSKRDRSSYNSFDDNPFSF